MSAPDNKAPATDAPGKRIEPEQELLSRRTRVIRIEIAPWTIFSLVLVFALTLPDLVNQGRSLIGMEPALRERLAVWFARSPLTAGLADTMRNVQYDALIKSSSASLLTFFTLVVESVAYGVGAIFLALYMMVDRDRLRGALFAVNHHV